VASPLDEEHPRQMADISRKATIPLRLTATPPHVVGQR
jgi:hypothetical protein